MMYRFAVLLPCRLAVVLAVLFAASGPSMVVAQVAGQGVGGGETAEDRRDALLAALDMPGTIDVMRAEGLVYGSELAAELFPGGSGQTTRWRAEVDRIYDPHRMTADFVRALDGELRTVEPADVAAMTRFFTSPLGRRVVGLELSARRALLDKAVTEASRSVAATRRSEGGARQQALADFVAANDLLEANVAGALNANLAFYQGLNESGAVPGEMTEDQMLADVWAQEDAIRAETDIWLYSYLGMAYQPLSDTELADYTAFSRTPAGVALNRSMFVAFDQMFARVSRDLGRSAAQFMTTQEL